MFFFINVLIETLICILMNFRHLRTVPLVDTNWCFKGKFRETSISLNTHIHFRKYSFQNIFISVYSQNIFISEKLFCQFVCTLSLSGEIHQPPHAQGPGLQDLCAWLPSPHFLILSFRRSPRDIR